MVEYEVFMASCPHCGAPVTEKACPYCKSILVTFPVDERKNCQSGLTSSFIGYAGKAAGFSNYDPVLKGINRCADDILSAYSKHSDAIYVFMEKHKIGHSQYGRLMDAAAKGKHIMAHRSFGHHFCMTFLYTIRRISLHLWSTWHQTILQRWGFRSFREKYWKMQEC